MSSANTPAKGSQFEPLVFPAVYTLLFWNGLTVLLKATGYPVLAAESLLAYLMFALLGLLLGWLAPKLGNLLLTFVSTLLFVLLLYLLFRPIPTIDWLPPEVILVAPLACFALVAVISKLSRTDQGFVFMAIAGAMFIGALFTPVSQYGWSEENQTVERHEQADLPPYVHVVLDEHIGIEGIPARFEEQQNVGAEITKAYIARDFRVFGRAFTRYKSTTLSFRSFMNFEFLDSEGTPQARTGRENALFAELAERGYDISVLQTTFLDLCHSASSSHRISQCRTYPFSPHLDSLRDSSLPISRKAMVIVNNVFIRMGVTDLVDRVAMSTPGVRLGLPRWPVGTCLNCIASKTALEEFERGIDGTARGRAFFVHLMWPHEPYQVYDQNCEPEMTPSLRRGSFDDRYAEYLEQVKCSQTALIGLLERLLRKDGFQDATIVVHGDHGGRLFESPAVGSRSVTRESVQAYSTFFAVRSPESEPGYDGRPYPVDDLLADVMGVEPAPGREEYRYTVANSDGLETIPPFARGVLSEDW